ncbi:hypothetical protein CLU79DRAFT_45212 [Phycomyces nitens]|nr:hypothetical protein CLU79DRAFT_45212 [Phycomyces nitens]
MAENKGSARDYVESYVKESQPDVEGYLSEQQPHYDPTKAPAQASSSSKPDSSPAPTPSQQFKLHLPTVNPIPTNENPKDEQKLKDQNNPKIEWAVRDFMDQKREIHETALENCADLHQDLFTCFKDGSWWDKARMCEDQKQRFWTCYHQQKVGIQCRKTSNLTCKLD